MENERTILNQHPTACKRNTTSHIAHSPGDLPAGNTVRFTPNVSAPFPPNIEEYPPKEKILGLETYRHADN
jgi:hypothetical protein